MNPLDTPNPFILPSGGAAPPRRPCRTWSSSAEMTAGELYRHRELEGTLRERHRQRLREQNRNKERNG